MFLTCLKRFKNWTTQCVFLHWTWIWSLNVSAKRSQLTRYFPSCRRWALQTATEAFTNDYYATNWWNYFASTKMVNNFISTTQSFTLLWKFETPGSKKTCLTSFVMKVFCVSSFLPPTALNIAMRWPYIKTIHALHTPFIGKKRFQAVHTV